MKQGLFNVAKNLLGWRTKRKLLVISVDDYGNVRVNSKNSLEIMEKAGLQVQNRFDALDSLETTQDLEALYDVLSSVKDSAGNSAIFTPFAMPCNINFEGMRENKFTQFENENLPDTYAKLESLQPDAYKGAWELWQQGIREGLMKPQFHGREHLNLKIFNDKLEKRDKDLMVSLENRSYSCIDDKGYPNISYTAAYEFEVIEENQSFEGVLKDGLVQFQKVFGYKSNHFNPPGGREHPSIHQYLNSKGVKYLDTPFLKNQHEGNGKYKRVLNWTGKKNQLNQTYFVRNAVFEPTYLMRNNWVEYCFNQIDTAFKLNRPAIVSSHRVNFCGHIDEANRNLGLESLKKLLRKVVQKYPAVEFVSSAKLGEIISGTEVS